MCVHKDTVLLVLWVNANMCVARLLQLPSFCCWVTATAVIVVAVGCGF